MNRHIPIDMRPLPGTTLHAVPHPQITVFLSISCVYCLDSNVLSFGLLYVPDRVPNPPLRHLVVAHPVREFEYF